MESDSINNVWIEGQIHSDGVSLSLLSESREGGARVEAVENLTFEELESREGDLFNMRLSDETRLAIDETNRLANIGRIFEDSDESGDELPEVGDCLTDQNPPPWSDNTECLEVVEVLEHVTCDEYVIQGRHEGQRVDKSKQDWTDKTVADANPSYDSDEPVVLAQYDGAGDWYAFPASRLA